MSECAPDRALVNGIDVGLPYLVTAVGNFHPWIHPREDGRYRAHFTTGARPTNLLVEDNITVGFVPNEHNTDLLGLFIPDKLAGNHLGTAVLRWLVAMSTEANQPLTSTCHIHKLLVALLLQNEGWKPRATDALAEILPPEDTESIYRQPPRIRWLVNNALRRHIITKRNPAKPFYILEGEKRIREQREPNCPTNPQVYLHTTYFAPSAQV